VTEVSISEQLTAIFSAANWTAGVKDGWNGSFLWGDASVIGGIDPWGTPRVTVVGARSPEDAAAWLVQHAIDLRLAPASEPEETPEHEAHEETGAEEGEGGVSNLGDETENASEPGGVPEPGEHDSGADDAADDIIERSDGNAEAGDDPRYAGVLGNGPASEPDFDPESESIEAEILDADFYEPDAPAIEGADLGAEILDEGQGGAFIFGDNLPQMRTAAIGLVVQISLAKQDAIWAEAGAGPDEYSQLMSAVVRDTVDGTYRGDQATYDRFVALSTYDNAARRVQNAERERVTMLTTADRATIEGFDPQADWP
jgi:hypothetical protein